MLRNDWPASLKVFGLGFASLAACALIFFVGYGIGSSGAYHDARSDGYSAQYRQQTDERVSRCFANAASPRETERCVSEAIEAGHESRRAESDLTAQRQMAQWAKWLLVATLAQVPLNVVGLFFLLKTIWQGQEALRHGQDVAYAELRAYLSLGKLNFTCVEQGRWQLEFLIRNNGQTPARDVDVALNFAWQAFPLESREPPAPDGRAPIRYPSVGPNSERGYRSILPVSDDRLAKIKEGVLCLRVSVAISYLTYTGERVSEPLTEWIASDLDLAVGWLRLVNESVFARRSGA